MEMGLEPHLYLMLPILPKSSLRLFFPLFLPRQLEPALLLKAQVRSPEAVLLPGYVG
jgi:hypothetical protein